VDDEERLELLLRDRALDLRRIDEERVGIDVHEDRRRSAVDDRVRGRDEGERRREDPVARTDVVRQQGRVERDGAVAHRHRVARAHLAREVLLEAGDLGPGRPLAAAKHPGYGGHVVVGRDRPRHRHRRQDCSLMSAKHRSTHRSAVAPSSPRTVPLRASP
jgi:hypothetical protein